jgi:hypothetical protein
MKCIKPQGYKLEKKNCGFNFKGFFFKKRKPLNLKATNLFIFFPIYTPMVLYIS